MTVRDYLYVFLQVGYFATVGNKNFFYHQLLWLLYRFNENIEINIELYFVSIFHTKSVDLSKLDFSRKSVWV